MSSLSAVISMKQKQSEALPKDLFKGYIVVRYLPNMDISLGEIGNRYS